MTCRRLFGFPRRKLHVPSLLAPCLLAVLAGACGGSSGPNLGPAAKFLGRWEIDFTSSGTTFAIECPTSMITTRAYLVWGEMVFEKGVLSDATESSGGCLPPGLAFDVGTGGSALTLSDPDPYTGAPSVCTRTIGADANMIPIFLDLSFSALTLTLLEAVAGEAPKALLSGAATGQIVQDDGTRTGNFVVVDTSCIYSGTGDTFHRMSQP
jgi:hypothetical protein